MVHWLMIDDWWWFIVINSWLVLSFKFSMQNRSAQDQQTRWFRLWSEPRWPATTGHSSGWGPQTRHQSLDHRSINDLSIYIPIYLSLSRWTYLPTYLSISISLFLSASIYLATFHRYQGILVSLPLSVKRVFIFVAFMIFTLYWHISTHAFI